MKSSVVSAGLWFARLVSRPIGKLRSAYVAPHFILYAARTARIEKRLLASARARYSQTYSQAGDPLISITIPTWNRGRLLAQRTLPSMLAQTYQNFEVVVVGDHCQDDTAERLAALGDPRIRFVNLEHRGGYPDDPVGRWRVAGTVPANRALDLARGDWLAYSDDDDVFLPNHLEDLLRFAQNGGYELVYGRFKSEPSPGVWVEGGSLPFGHTNVPHSAVLYRSYLRFFKYNIDAYRHNLPADADLWERMKRAGVRVGFLPKVVSLQPLRPGETGLSLNAESTAK